MKLNTYEQLQDAYFDWLVLPITGAGQHCNMYFGQYIWSKYGQKVDNSLTETNAYLAFQMIKHLIEKENPDV